METCCGRAMNKKIDFKYYKNEIGCDFCNGSGQSYLSDGVYGECECGYGYGAKAVFFECLVCFHSKEDITRKITSRRIRAHLRMMIIKKDKLTINRIESLFVGGMNWNNRKEWHIDHIKPIKVFLDEGVTDYGIINHISNLQPLWARDNLTKGAKYLEK